MGVRRSFVLVPLLAFVAVAGAAKDVPFLSGRVNDTANLLSADARQRVEGMLQAFEKQNGAQIAVLTIDSLEGDVLEDYSMRVAETWKLGRKGIDDGVLFLIARDDRKMRLEVGYGLEGKLPDAICRRILDNVVRPRFRAGDFAGGIEAGVEAVIGTIEGKAGAVPVEAPDARQSLEDAPLAARIAGMLIFTLVVGVFSVLAVLSKGCASWFLYLFLVPFQLAFPAAFIHPWAGWVFGGLWLLGFPILKIVLAKTTAGKAFLASHPTLASFGSASGRSGGWTSGGGSWSSSGSSGGFSGGGGSFGGGGSSSSW